MATAHKLLQHSESDSLSRFTELMNELLPVNEVVGDPQPSVEARRGLLEDVRSVRDVCAQERARTENQLFAAQQTVTALSTELRMADEKLSIMEDLIGEVRIRMHRRGLTTFPVVQRPSPRTVPEATSSHTPPPSQPRGLDN